jgi:hypothetical protein
MYTTRAGIIKENRLGIGAPLRVSRKNPAANLKDRRIIWSGWGGSGNRDWRIAIPGARKTTMKDAIEPTKALVSKIRATLRSFPLAKSQTVKKLSPSRPI